LLPKSVVCQSFGLRFGNFLVCHRMIRYRDEPLVRTPTGGVVVEASTVKFAGTIPAKLLDVASNYPSYPAFE
jgi:hypothetical protein